MEQATDISTGDDLSETQMVPIKGIHMLPISFSVLVYISGFRAGQPKPQYLLYMATSSISVSFSFLI